MGGGWGKRGSGVPLAERVRAGAEPQHEQSAPQAGPAGSLTSCPARHCWVAGAVDDLGVKRPGLLVEWRAVDGRWQGRVTYPALLQPGRWVLVEEWVPAELLTPC